MSPRWTKVFSLAVAGAVSLGTAAVGFAICYKIADTVNCGDESLDAADPIAGVSSWSSCELARDYNIYAPQVNGPWRISFISGAGACGNTTVGIGGYNQKTGQAIRPLVWMPIDIPCVATTAVPC